MFGYCDPNTWDVVQLLLAKNTRLAARVFLRFSQASQRPACLDHSIQTSASTLKEISFLRKFEGIFENLKEV